MFVSREIWCGQEAALLCIASERRLCLWLRDQGHSSAPGRAARAELRRNRPVPDTSVRAFTRDSIQRYPASTAGTLDPMAQRARRVGPLLAPSIRAAAPTFGRGT